MKKNLSSINKFYEETLDYDWVEVADQFLGPETFFHRLREKEVVKLIRESGKGEKFLDAGCGTGLILRHLPKGSFGLDINQKMLEKARKNAPGAKLIKGDLEKIPFKDSEFDIVVCTEVLEHFPDPQKPLGEIQRVLKKGGTIIGSVPRKSFLWNLQKLSLTRPQVPYHENYQKERLMKLFSDFKLRKLKKGCFGLLYLFVFEKI